jgi:hypothetical protein
MRLVSTSLILIGALLRSAHAEGDALVDTLGPREIAVGEAMRGGATGSTAIGLNPAGLPLTRELVFEGGYGYRFSDAASLIGISACDSTNAAPGCFFYQYAGSSPELGGTTMSRRTHIAGGSFAYRATPRILLGTTIKYFNFKSELMDEPKASGFTFDVGTTIRVTDLVSLGVTGYNLWGEKSPEFARAVGGGLYARPIPSLAFGFDARWKLDGDDHTARYGGGAELFMRSSSGQTGFPLRIGALRDNGLDSTYLSGGLGVTGMKFGIDLAVRHAVTGTDETMLLASLRFFGPRMGGGSFAGE